MAILIKGGTLVTAAETFPADILIGQVISTRKIETDIFQTASVQSAVDFTNLRAVLVITNFRPVEITPLLPTQIP